MISQMNASELLRAKDWPRLAELFAARQPATAHEFQARALLTLHSGGQRPNWEAVHADLRRACELEPRDSLLHLNFAQALMDGGKFAEARDEAQTACKLAPTAPPAYEKLALASAALQQWEAALGALDKLKGLIGDRSLPDPLAKLLQLLRSRWWEPYAFGAITLRLPQPGDEAFVASAFQDRAFMRQFHRMQATSAAGIASFIGTSRLLPLQTRRLDWIVLDSTGQAIGIAGLVDVDWGNDRAEFLVGLPGSRSPTAALQASAAAIDFAFRRLQLQKLVTHVYGDNPVAQANVLHLGFVEEGLLRSQIASEGQRIDLHASGMLRSEYEASELHTKLRARWAKDGGAG